MTMMSGTRAWVAIAIAAASGMPAAAAERHRPACLSETETRAAVEARKTIPPVRAVEAAGRAATGESVSIRLCRDEATMVYDIGVLRRDGRLVHVLVDAATGNLVPAKPEP